MHTSTHSLALRVNPRNPNHHLWNNHGTWFVHYTVHQGPFKQRRRASLGTSDLARARERRDVLFAQLAAGADSLASFAAPRIAAGRAA